MLVYVAQRKPPPLSHNRASVRLTQNKQSEDIHTHPTDITLVDDGDHNEANESLDDDDDVVEEDTVLARC